MSNLPISSSSTTSIVVVIIDHNDDDDEWDGCEQFIAHSITPFHVPALTSTTDLIVVVVNSTNTRCSKLATFPSTTTRGITTCDGDEEREDFGDGTAV